jgi:uncharacterized protein YabN with tetrapyrrole methylase and pyrophosphatase domain
MGIKTLFILTTLLYEGNETLHQCVKQYFLRYTSECWKMNVKIGKKERNYMVHEVIYVLLKLLFDKIISINN